MKIISFKNVSKKFGNYLALDNLNFEVEPHNFITVAGPNGAGKSTLIKLLLGLEKPSEGTISIFGEKPGKFNKAKIGYVPQIKTLDRSFPALPFELVATGMEHTWCGFTKKQLVEKAREAMELTGIGYLKKTALSRLSGGELQRIYLARAIIRKPDLLFLDEPASGVDQVGEYDMHNILENLKGKFGITIFMVTHDWEAAYHHSDKVLLLNSRQICFDDPKNVFKEKFLREAYGHVGHTHEMIFGAKNA